MITAPELHPNTKFVINWIDRMAEKYTGEIRDRETGKRFDLGQALMRHRYGVDWHKLRIDDPDDESVRLAIEWENGKQPNWVEFI